MLFSNKTYIYTPFYSSRSVQSFGIGIGCFCSFLWLILDFFGNSIVFVSSLIRSDEFAKANQKTMVWKDDESLSLGGDVMSTNDVIKLNTYYQCSNFPTLSPGTFD